jgi:hypothetical protein
MHMPARHVVHAVACCAVLAAAVVLCLARMLCFCSADLEHLRVWTQRLSRSSCIHGVATCCYRHQLIVAGCRHRPEGGRCGLNGCVGSVRPLPLLLWQRSAVWCYNAR